MAFTPYGYQNPYYPPPMQDNLMQMRQQFQAPAPAPQQDMIWVQGETGAKSYLVANGHTVPLWDSENQTVYIKSVDGAGMPSMRILDYTERTAAPRAAQAPAVEYVPAQVAALTKEKEGEHG